MCSDRAVIGICSCKLQPDPPDGTAGQLDGQCGSLHSMDLEPMGDLLHDPHLSRISSAIFATGFGQGVCLSDRRSKKIITPDTYISVCGFCDDD